MSVGLEYSGFVLEDQLLDHLATPEGATAVWKERLIPEVVPEKEQGIRDALSFVIEYMDEYRTPPDVSVLSEETGYDEFNEPVAPIGYVIGKLRERYQSKELRKVLTKMGRLAADPEQSLGYGLGELLRIRTETAPVGSSITSHDLLSTVDDYIARQENPLNGLSFGFPDMDKQLGGLMLGEVYVVLARPKRFKSWMLLKSAYENYCEGKTVYFETMELPEKEMRDRFTCMVAGVSWYRFKHSIMAQPELDRIARAAEEQLECEHKMYFHRSKIGQRKAPIIIELARDHEADVLYLDQLSWFDGAKDEGGWRVIGQIMEQLKDGSMSFPIMMAAQYNRAQASEEGIGDIANIALGQAIGETADMLLGIFASSDMKQNGIVHYGVVESRSFEPTTWEVKVALSETTNFKALNVISAS